MPLARHELTERLRHDALTGLPNRVLITDRLRTALARAQRMERTVAVLFVDLDGFKAVNDTLGHAVGDALLIGVASRLRGALRASDTLARLGGDEFAVVAEGADEAGARETAARLLKALATPVMVDGRPVTVSASVGVACAWTDDHALLLERADAAMYEAKAAGKNAYAVFPTATHAWAPVAAAPASTRAS